MGPAGMGAPCAGHRSGNRASEPSRAPRTSAVRDLRLWWGRDGRIEHRAGGEGDVDIVLATAQSERRGDPSGECPGVAGHGGGLEMIRHPGDWAHRPVARRIPAFRHVRCRSHGLDRGAVGVAPGPAVAAATDIRHRSSYRSARSSGGASRRPMSAHNAVGSQLAAGREASIRSTISGASGSTFERKRCTSPAGVTTNFSKFHFTLPALPSASAVLVSSAKSGC